MGLEAATYIHELNPLNPVGATDPKAQGDDHLRMIKSAIQASFPSIAGVMTVSHTVLNQWGGLTAAYNWSGQHRGIDGVAGAPAFSFTSDPNTGVYLNGADDMRFAAGGTLMAAMLTAGIPRVSIQVATAIQNGSVGTPGLFFENDTNSGMYFAGADNFRFAAGGIDVLGLGTVAGVPLLQPFGAIQHVFDGTVGNPIYSFNNDPDTGFWRSGANELTISAGGAQRFTVSNTLVYSGAQNLGTDGTISAPQYSFLNDPDSGIYRPASGVIEFSSDGVQTLQLSNGRVRAGDGSAALPGFAFISDADTGFYRIGSDAIGFAEGASGFRIGFRSVPRSTTATTLASGDVGKCVAVSAAINIPASVFVAGDCISIYNDSAASVNITTSAGTLRLAGTGTTGTRALGARGMATLWFNVGGATPEVICSGAGVS